MRPNLYPRDGVKSCNVEKSSLGSRAANTFRFVIVFAILFAHSVAIVCSTTRASEPQETDTLLPTLGQRMTNEQVAAFAKLALKNIHREYPNKTGDVLAGPESIKSPKQLHPAFYGCFDWHSSVHGHWMLVKLLKDYPDHPICVSIRDSLATNLTQENLDAELAYFQTPEHKTFERTYGWAWYLRLVAELHEWEDEQGQQWREHVRPLELLLVKRTLDYLPKLSFPIRTGVHADTGFALGQILDYARGVKNDQLERQIINRAKAFYLNDVDYPTKYEPSGQDFFSSCLNEADLMRRVLSSEAFADWLDGYLPSLKLGDGGNLLEPVSVSDVTDGYIVHLAGLNLSRAWCLRSIAAGLPKGDARIKLLEDSAAKHAAKGFGYVFSGAYEGEHWLATFAIYLQTRK